MLRTAGDARDMANAGGFGSDFDGTTERYVGKIFAGK
jgi:hypothetical protein